MNPDIEIKHDSAADNIAALIVTAIFFAIALTAGYYGAQVIHLATPDDNNDPQAAALYEELTTK